MNERLKQVNHQFADPNEAPAEPRPAATVLLVRDVQGQGIEVFLIERAAKTNFGGAYVFPGGKVDLEDASGRLSDMCQGVSDADASSALGMEKGGLAYWVAVIRECFEEAGILLAYRKDGNNFDPEDESENERFINFRKRLNDGEIKPFSNTIEIESPISISLILLFAIIGFNSKIEFSNPGEPPFTSIEESQFSLTEQKPSSDFRSKETPPPLAEPNQLD